MNDLLNVDQAARALGIQASTLRAWVLRRKVPYLKIKGKIVRFRAQDIEKILADSVVTPRPTRDERRNKSYPLVS